MHDLLQGIVSEFSLPKAAEIVDRSSLIYDFQWIYVNGLLGVIFSIGLLYTALKSRRARSWLYGIGWSHVFLFLVLLNLILVQTELSSYTTSSNQQRPFNPPSDSHPVIKLYRLGRNMYWA